MYYTIGEVAQKTGINISTLRYYDKEGLFPSIKRTNGGVRVFSDTEIEVIEMIGCLKSSGMSIKDIKQFFVWCSQGNNSLEKRLNMFKQRLDVIQAQMDELQTTMDAIKFKCWYYETAIEAGDEEAVKNMPLEDIPQQIRAYRKALHK